MVLLIWLASIGEASYAMITECHRHTDGSSVSIGLHVRR